MEFRRFLQQHPFFKLYVSLLMGILLGFYIQSSLNVALSILAICAILFVTAHFFLRSIRFAGWSSALGLMVIVGLGNFLTMRTHHKNIPNHYLQKNIHHQWVLAKVVSFPEPKEKSLKVLLQLQQHYQHKWLPVNGKLLAYIALDSNAHKIHKNDILFFKLTSSEIPSPQNPGAFDFKQYCSNNGIIESQYLAAKTYRIFPKKHVSFIEICSNYTKDIIQKNIQDSSRQALASGIIIGLKTKLDEHIYEQFQHAGIIHILSVSGLHLGIVLAIFQFVFGLFPSKNKKMLLAQTLFILIFIWIFALLTGFSAAVQRAAVMVTIYLVGKYINRKTSGLNLMFASAFILCCIQPSLIYDIGFQLSYLAIFGLIVFYPSFYKLMYFKNKWFDKLWQLSCVSFAAQLATWPLILYQFGSFPVYFLLANPPAIFLSFLILAGGIALFAIGWIPFFGTILGGFIGLCCNILIKVTASIDSLPYAHWENIYSTKWNLLLNFIIVFLLAIIVLFRMKIKWTILTAFLVIISFFHAGISLKKIQADKRLIVYSIPKHIAIGIQSGERLLVITDDSLITEPKLLKYNISNGMKALGVKHLKYETIHGNLLNVKEKKILIWEKRMNYLPAKNGNDIDYIYLRKGVFLQTNQLKSFYPNATVILDAGFSEFSTELISDSLRTQRMDVVALKKGAMMMTTD